MPDRRLPIDYRCRWCGNQLAVAGRKTDQWGTPQGPIYVHADTGAETCTIERHAKPYDGYLAERRWREAENELSAHVDDVFDGTTYDPDGCALCAEGLARGWLPPDDWSPPEPPTQFRVTFGQRYRTESHPTFPSCDPSGWVTILARDVFEARACANTTFGDAWSMLYPSDQMDESFFPHGEITRLTARQETR